MSIIRVDKHTENFVIMHKTGLEDERLSFKAKGLLAYLLSRPDNWNARISHLQTVSTDGKHSVQSALKELENNGYLTKDIVRNSDGTIREWESIIREIPGSSPDPDFPDLDNLDLDNPPLISNELTSNEKNNNRANNNNIYQRNEGETDASVVVNSLNNKFKNIAGYEDPGFIAGLLAFYEIEDIEKQLKNMELYAKHNKLDNPQGFLLAALKGNWSVPQTNTKKADQQSNKLLQQIKTWKEEATSQEVALEYLQSMKKNQRGN